MTEIPNHKRLLVSFSGGETSAYMLWCLLNDKEVTSCWHEIVIVFANTGEEHPSTLKFVDYVDRNIANCRVVWVESVVRHNQRKSCGHRIVDYSTAIRGPDLFIDMALKYGVPNKSYPHCTRSLKLDPITSYVRDELKWPSGGYSTAIGIRKDEADRISSKASENGIIYPLVNMFPATKKDVNAFWKKQPCRLEITGYQGNCVWCWKKTLRKHYTLITEDPSRYDTPKMLERDYALHGHNVYGTPRKIFRENKTVKDLITGAQEPFEPFHDENRVYDDPLLDVGGGCGESCEVWSDE